MDRVEPALVTDVDAYRDYPVDEPMIFTTGMSPSKESSMSVQTSLLVSSSSSNQWNGSAIARSL